jgi:signal transduction histidine kinase
VSPRNVKWQVNATDIVFSIVRLSAFLGGLGWIAYHPLAPQIRSYLYFLVFGFLFYSLILYYLVFRFPDKARRIYFVEFILDLALLSFILPMTGGMNSAFAYGLLLAAALHSFYYGLLLSIGVAVLTAAVYIFSCPQCLLFVHWTDISLRILFLFLIAATLGFLSERERWMHRKLVRKEQLAAMGLMSSQIAHAVRNPLSTISLSTEMLSDELKKCRGADMREADSLINSIMNEVERLDGVVDECLLFVKQPELAYESCEISQMLESLIKFLDKEASRRNITLMTNFEKDLPQVAMDGRKLRQALINILRNSFDAMPQGGRIHLSTRKLKDEVEMTIEDTGTGIPKEHLKRIFEPFFSTKDLGTGLGLSIARDIIMEHGGGISCESKEGQGTIVKIRLPFSR